MEGAVAPRCHTERVTHGRAEIHELLLANELHPSRALGQNFVADANTVRRIVRLAGVEPGTRVVEIGAGLGSLTLALAEAGARVTAVEVDRHVLPVLRARGRARGRPGGGRRRPDHGLRRRARPRTGWSLVANLPYNVAVPLVMRVLEEAPQVASLLVMVQREVGERLAARARDDAYGAVSVKVAYWATAAVVGKVSASVFIPRPRVESVLVRLDRRADRLRRRRGTAGPGTPEYDRLFAVVRGGFAHRRKMLRRSLDGPGGPRGVRGGRHRPDGPGRGAGPRRVAAPRLVASRGLGRAVSAVELRPATVAAPAKLTVSLRVTGVRPDGYHLLDSEMVTLDLADTLEITPSPGGGGTARGGHRLAGRGRRWARPVRRTGRQPGHPGPGRHGAHGPGPPGQAHPPGRRPRGWVGRRRRRAALGRVCRPAVAAALGADVPFCLSGGRARVDRHRRGGRRPFRSWTGSFVLVLPPFGVDTVAVYRAWDAARPPGAGTATRARRQRPGGCRTGRRAPPGRVARRPEAATGRRPRLAGSGSTWFVEGDRPGAGREDRAGWRSGGGVLRWWRRGRRRRWVRGAAVTLGTG